MPAELRRVEHAAGARVHHPRHHEADPLAPLFRAVRGQEGADALGQRPHEVGGGGDRVERLERDRRPSDPAISVTVSYRMLQASPVAADAPEEAVVASMAALFESSMNEDAAARTAPS